MTQLSNIMPNIMAVFSSQVYNYNCYLLYNRTVFEEEYVMTEMK